MNAEQTTPEDPTAVSRKKDHIELAFRSQVERLALDNRFYYEPVLAAHPKPGSLTPVYFLGKTLKTPIWVSSMTGGTALARTINRNLARVCAEFGMGMGLGSCRQLLYSDEYLTDFDVRDIIGDEFPLYANLGIAQVENLLRNRQTQVIRDLLNRLQADGLIVHINPLQEAMQPEGDFFERSPLDTLTELLQVADYPVIAKEVGQGMGPNSLRALLHLPLAAIEFAAAGGTNFAKLELLRSSPEKQEIFQKFAHVGHSAEEMVEFINRIHAEPDSACRVNNLILSGGVGDFMDGYYLICRSGIPAVYGQASGFLRHAQGEYDDLHAYVSAQVRGLELANAFLKVR